MKYGNKIFLREGIGNKKIDYINDPELFEMWRTRKTGNNFVDVNIIELLKQNLCLIAADKCFKLSLKRFENLIGVRL